MEQLFKKLDELSEMLAKFNASIKQPKAPTLSLPKPTDSLTPKLPSPSPTSKKDPMRVDAQGKNKQLKPKIKIAANGQWSMPG